MIGEAIDTFRNTKPPVNQEFVSESQIETSICHTVCLVFKKLICQSCLFRLRHFAATYLRSQHSKQRENGQVPAKKRALLAVYTR